MPTTLLWRIKMIEKKKEDLYDAVNKAWDNVFDGWEWIESESNPNMFILGENDPENGFAFFLAGCEDSYGGIIWIEYEPEKDMVGVYIRERSIQAKFTEDLKNLFEKYSPFDMKVSFKWKTVPIISRKEKVEPKDLLNFFKDFRKAYNEYYPLFYMFSVSAKEWYDGFSILGSDC